MKRSIAVTIVVGLLVGSFVFLTTQKAARSAEPIKIGVVYSITGWGGFIGSPMKDALMAIVEDVNKKGGILGRPIELYLEDDKSNPTNAVVAATKLIRDIKVSVITGTSVVDSGMALLPLCEQEQIPFVVTGPIVSPLRKWVFLTGPGDVRGASFILEFAAKELGAKRIALLYDSASYGMTGARVYNKEIGKYPGSTFIIQEKFETTDTSMVPQLMRIKSANPDLIILHTAAGPASVIAKNYKQLGMKTPVLCSHAVGLAQFVQNAGPIAEESKWIFMGVKNTIAEKLPTNDPYRRDLYEPFKKLMKERYGTAKEINIFHATAYDGIHVAMEALKAARSDDRAAVRAALEKIRWEGFLGSFACSPEDHQGAQSANTVGMTISGGQFVPYSK